MKEEREKREKGRETYCTCYCWNISMQYQYYNNKRVYLKIKVNMAFDIKKGKFF